MKAVRIHEFGDAGVLSLEDVERPRPGPGELLLEIRAAGVNPVDYKTREGQFPPVQAKDLPITLGREAAGVVVEVGAGETRFVEGDEVYAMLPMGRGGYAECAAVPADACALKPDCLDMIQAGATPLAALTAWQGLFTHGRLAAGQRVLIHGAAGGVGHFAVQFAKAKGAEVTATAAGAMRDFVRGLGAERVIDYREEDFASLVSEFDLVFDLIGGDTQTRSFGVLKRGGVLISTVQEPDAEMAREAGVRAERYMAQPDGGQLTDIAELIDAGEVRVTIERVFPLAEAAKAEEHLEQDHVMGKVGLEVARD
jgi:NADPH:quinone reductase-like Zn-dependent oxidoreductase